MQAIPVKYGLAKRYNLDKSNRDKFFKQYKKKTATMKLLRGVAISELKEEREAKRSRAKDNKVKAANRKRDAASFFTGGETPTTKKKKNS